MLLDYTKDRMKFLSLMFSEPGGSPSSTRAMACMVCGCVGGAWTFVTVMKVELQPLTPEHVMLVGVALGAKVWQRGKENGHENKEPTK